MYYIRQYKWFIRYRNVFFSTKNKLSGVKQLDSQKNDLTSSNELPSQEFISPLYTQKTGMFAKPGVPFSEDKAGRFRTYKLYLFSFVSFIVIVSMIKIIPPGHVGIVVRKDGNVDQFNNKGRLALFHIPFIEKPIAFRITPIRKKIIRKCETSDGKSVEVVVFLTLTAKIPFSSHIYSIYGVNYSNGFVEKELNFDIDQVIKKFKMDDLILNPDVIENLEHKKGNIYSVNSSIEKANKEMIERFEDAGSFNKIIVSDVVSPYIFIQITINV
ncbi:prohibitin-like protein, putative [Theileria annulata]|uniref:Prohibitin-like protein, putative n=1 Tax=Theileria annulata TaxID=5874 RepID=Q4U9D0_THEAN|nr:prohibitin-like protein, putative [Theileria annulata]CAI76573.1 prohibitin-like protein, putative [Theileria annulata]|eukprot:XP_953198.1 prohibitin-like protein, putative [Theileria annulata]